MALGTVRFFQRGRIETTINGARYEIAFYRLEPAHLLPALFGLA